MARFRERNGQLLWETTFSLNPDRPRKKDIIVQSWVTTNSDGDRDIAHYMVRIYADGSGWDVFGQLDRTNSVQATLDAIL